MATMQDFLGNMAAPVRNRSAVRLALHNPNARSASDIADVERTARTLNMGYGLADAGGQDAALEARAREIEQNPIADAWTAKAEENIAFLNEDQQALADVYDSLVDSGILHEADADRETVINASGAGDDVSAAWQRGVIQNRIAGYGLQFQRGEYENLDELRAKILAAKKELESLRGDASDALGIYGAIEQLPRMIGYDAPYAGAGALAGGVIGSVVPGVGTLAGAGVGSAMGMAYTAANSEQGSFAADLLVQKDDAGNYLGPAAIQKAASLYGLFSGAVEVGGDALMLKLFKPVGGAIREAFSRTAARDAIRNAAAHSSLWPALRSFAGGAGKAAAVEGTQEFVQEGLSTQIEASTRNLLSDTGLNYFREHQAGAFSREGLSRMLEAGWSAAKTGPWFYAVPGGVKLTLDTRSALRAQEFAKAHKELADKVAATKTRELSPARMESYLQTAGLDGEVLIPADAAWELQQKGTDLAGPLGWDVRDMEEAAALGHDLVMPAARLQALLPPEQMKAVADIMRESPNAKSALEAAKLNEDLPADLDGLIEQAEDDALERAAVEGEIARLRAEMTQAVTSSPHLVGQISSDTDPETGVARYVDSQLGLIAQRARVLTYMGIPMSDTLSRFSFRGQGKVEQGHTVTQEEADALAPFWDEVWGRIDADSLRVDFPDARRELAYRHGRGLFAKKGEGLSVDTLAGELKRRGLLEEDADASTLIERLKVMERPDRRRLRERQKTVSVSLIQTPAENDMAYPDNDTPSVREGITRKPDSATANVVNVSGDIVPDFEGGRGKHKTRKLVEWLYSYFDAPVDVIIASTGQKVRIGKSGLEASVKKEKEPGHREAYGALKELVEKAEYDRFEPADERHKSRVLGQDVYYSALRLGEHLYSVQLKFDVPNAAEVESRKRVGENSIEDSRYKDHELREIEIAPAEVDGVFTRPSADAISEVSLGVLRGAVKPSRVDGGTLFQSAYHGTPTYYQFIGELGAKNLDRATEAATRLDNLAVAREMEDAGRDAEAGQADAGKAAGLLQAEIVPQSSLDAVRKRYKGTDAWMKAPDGSPTALTEEQWLLIRTPEFKKIFGDWEAGAGWNFAMTASPVSSLSGQEFASDGVPLTEKVTAFYFREYGGSVLNRELGRVILDKEGVKASLGHGMGRMKAAAYAAVPEIIRKGVVYNRAENWKNRGYDTAVIIAPVEIKGELYVGEVVVVRRPNKTNFYLHEVALKKGLLEEFKTPTEGSSPKARLIIAQHFEDIKNTAHRLDAHGEPRAEAITEISGLTSTQHAFLNQGNAFALGSTTPNSSGHYLIRLFHGANLSTLTHETAHVFFLEMERLEREGLADEKMLADLAALREWTAAMDDDAALKAEYDRYQKHAVYGGTEFDALPDYLKEDVRSRAKQEMLARGFEQYLREGKAPSRRLESLFRRFRKWLMRVYRDALNLHVELTDDVRDVFDRMLTHEEDMKLRPEADSSLMKGLKKKQAHSEYYQLTDENSRKLRQKFDNSPTAIMRGNEIFNADHPFPEKMADRRNAVIAWLEKKGWLSKFENKDTGWEIAVSRGSIRDTSSHGMNEGKAQVLAALPELITNAIYVGEGVPKKVGHKRYIFAAKAQVAKKAYVVGLVVDEDHNGKRFYNHELTEIEDLDGPSLDRLPEGGITEANQGLSVLNLIRKKLGVNINMLLQSAHHGVPLVSEGITRSISGQNGGLKNAIVSPGPDGNTHHQPGIGGGTLFQGISADVRDVFDRMLAHEEEMELRAEAAEVREETARLLDMLGLKGARRQETEGLITAAKDDAAEKLRLARDAERLKQRRTWTREAREQMEREQVYIARRAMRRTPIDLAGFNEVNGEELGRELVRKLPGAATRRKDGVEAEVLAAEQGYESAAAMARDIISSPTPGERVRQLVEQRQAEHDALFDAGEYLFGQEQLAEQQERLAEALEAKMRHIPAERRYLREERGSGAGGEETALTPDARAGYGATALRHVGRDQLRAQALAVLDRKPMGEEVLPEAFRRAAGRWMREERRAVLRGDFGKALQANYRARINIELARQSAERRRMLRELERKAQEFLETDRADSDARFAVLVLSQNIGLFNPTRKMLADAGGRGWKNVEAFASRMREEGFMGTEDAFDRELFTTSRAWKGMNRSEFRPYAETMTMIMHMEKESRTAYTAQGRMDLEKRAKEVADSIQGKNRRRKAGTAAKRDSSLELLKKFRAEDLKAEAVAALLEGNAMGQALKAVTRPVLDATRTQAERLKRERDTLKTLFSVYSRQELADMQGKRFTVPGLPDAMTKEQALAVLLNCGNAGNRQRLMAGQNFTEEQIRAIIDTLDERDVRFAQSVWKYLETFGKECFELEEKLTGVRPEAVSARPVQTRFGLLRGGYYPLVCDRESSLAAADADSSGTQGGALFPSVDSGAVKRGRREAAGPLFLSLDVIPRHVAETVHLLVFRRPVIEAAKILHRREVNEAIRETAGAATAEALDAWLRHVAGQRPARNGWSRAASWARKNAALHAMGLRLSTMLAQTTGLLSAVGKIGPHWTLRGVVDSYGQGRPWDVYRTVRELSPMMRNRMASIEHEASAVSSRFAETGSSGQGADPFMRMKSFMEAHGLVPMGLVHLFFAELPAWNGAYAGALKENGGNVAEAVLYADAVVARMQGSSGGKREASAVRRGQTPARIMSMFYACFSALYTLSARRIAMHDGRRDAASVYRLATLALLTWFAEPVLMGLLKGGPKSRNAEDMPDAEDWFSWGAKDAFFNPFSMIIDVQEASSMTDSVNSGKVGRTRLTSAPALPDLFDSAMRFGERVGKAVEGEGDEQKLAQHGEKPVEQVDFINEQDFLLLERFRDWLAGTSPELELGELIRKKKQAGGDAPGGTMDRVKRAE
ncbi:MAG TPA: hypothetical protein H9768_00415 [Candidatus Mailhella merdavium]|nr:hypothetical protein [Candidatus Mailhella merdavium]